MNRLGFKQAARVCTPSHTKYKMRRMQMIRREFSKVLRCKAVIVMQQHMAADDSHHDNGARAEPQPSPFQLLLHDSSITGPPHNIPQERIHACSKGDVLLVCKDNKAVQCHSQILTIASKVFCEMFESTKPCSDHSLRLCTASNGLHPHSTTSEDESLVPSLVRIPVGDDDAHDWLKVLKYLYPVNVKGATSNSCIAVDAMVLATFADKYDISKLASIVSDFVAATVRTAAAKSSTVVMAHRSSWPFGTAEEHLTKTDTGTVSDCLVTAGPLLLDASLKITRLEDNNSLVRMDISHVSASYQSLPVYPITIEHTLVFTSFFEPENSFHVRLDPCTIHSQHDEPKSWSVNIPSEPFRKWLTPSFETDELHLDIITKGITACKNEGQGTDNTHYVYLTTDPGDEEGYVMKWLRVATLIGDRQLADKCMECIQSYGKCEVRKHDSVFMQDLCDVVRSMRSEELAQFLQRMA